MFSNLELMGERLHQVRRLYRRHDRHNTANLPLYHTILRREISLHTWTLWDLNVIALIMSNKRNPCWWKESEMYNERNVETNRASIVRPRCNLSGLCATLWEIKYHCWRHATPNNVQSFWTDPLLERVKQAREHVTNSTRRHRFRQSIRFTLSSQQYKRE